MCELHLHRCPTCGARWVSHKKLASCESSDPTSRCPESLCMYVGNPKRPGRGECGACTQVREALEAFDDDAYFCSGYGALPGDCSTCSSGK
ncbi:hypothetical protein GCG54_00004506 [Colletotrichum gloeosporioides]|uniref:Uncharacterized protein n=1 Tax=Colletotrichum gloeosporioides TaxID=474922 RepID=A0A8H4C5P6_COLGL|nr:uncharacterized protein GCG54_00004506 [Colletotrichum gloeosporioides]KAF3797876.1 hypothetical protein GCG54_00004506 [Colletotrichum gloeosporioides]